MTMNMLQHSHSYYYTIFLIFVYVAAYTVAFVPLERIQQQRSTPKLGVLWNPLDEKSSSSISGFVEFPTDKQRTEIKKEAKKRKSRRQLPFYKLPDDEENIGPEIFQEVWKKLTKSEMIEIKGIMPEDKRLVFQTALLFCKEMEEMISASSADHVKINNDSDDVYEEGDDDDEEGSSAVVLPVALLSTKGHTALIYCPTLPVDHPDKFILRTSVGQKNVWSARPKPLRDSSGQIINGL